MRGLKIWAIISLAAVLLILAVMRWNGKNEGSIAFDRNEETVADSKERVTAVTFSEPDVEVREKTAEVGLPIKSVETSDQSHPLGQKDVAGDSADALPRDYDGRFYHISHDGPEGTMILPNPPERMPTTKGPPTEAMAFEEVSKAMPNAYMVKQSEGPGKIGETSGGLPEKEKGRD